MTAKNILGNYSDPTGVYTFDGLGLVPIGGIIAIGDAGAWTLPANGQIKDGWALCNGQAKPAGSMAGIAANLPNLTDDRFLNGSTVAGSTGGATSKTTTDINARLKKDQLGTGQINHTHSIAHSHVVMTRGDRGGLGGSWNSSSLAFITDGNISHSDASSNVNTYQFQIGLMNSYGTYSSGSQGVAFAGGNFAFYSSQPNNTSSGNSTATWTTYSSSDTNTYVDLIMTQGTIADIRPKYLNVVYVMRVK